MTNLYATSATSGPALADEIAEAAKFLELGDAERAYALLTDLRLRYPDDDRITWPLARCVAALQDPATALSLVRSNAAAEQMPGLASVATRQAAELLETRLLVLHQSGLLEKFATGIGRLQDINDSLGERVRTLEARDRSVQLYADHDLAASAAPSSWRFFNVLFVSASPHSPSHSYRIDNYKEALGKLNVASEVITFGEFDKLCEAVARSSLVVFWRCPLRADLLPVLQLCRLHQVPTVFDVDDYVFEPRIAKPEIIDGLRFVAPKDVEMYHWGVKVYRRLLLLCDATTVTTQYLADQVSRLGRPAHVLPNGLDVQYVAQGQKRIARNDGDSVTLGYAPGSKTHQRDFAECASAVAKILRENPTVRFLVIGPLDLHEFSDFKGLQSQIIMDITIGRDHLRRKLEEVDIHIAPIEMNNPFTESKSELKYFEPAALGIPTVASSTQPFRAAIQDGVNGFLASNQDEWGKALRALVGNKDLRKTMGERARAHALDAYGLKTLGRQAMATYADIIRQHRIGRGLTQRCLSICLLLGDVPARYYRDEPVIAMARGLVDLGHHVRLHFTAAVPGVSCARTRDQFDFPPTVAISMGNASFKPVDALVATSGSSAEVAAGLRGQALVGCYLVTEYEPLLHGSGHASALALQSYLKGLRPVALGPFVAHCLTQTLGESPPAMSHFIDHRIFNSSGPNTHADLSIVIAASRAPGDLNRLAFLAIEAVRETLSRPVSVDVIGMWTEPEGRGYRLHGIPSAQERATLFRRATLGLALAPSAPSAFAFEMMACGLPVIDIAGPDASHKYGSSESDGPLLVTATLGELSSAVTLLSGDGPDRLSRRNAGLALAQQQPNQHGAADQLETIIVDLVEACDARH